MDHSTLRTTPLENFPPPSRWDDWEEGKWWPDRAFELTGLKSR